MIVRSKLCAAGTKTICALTYFGGGGGINMTSMILFYLFIKTVGECAQIYWTCQISNETLKGQHSNCVKFLQNLANNFHKCINIMIVMESLSSQAWGHLQFAKIFSICPKIDAYHFFLGQPFLKK